MSPWGAKRLAAIQHHLFWIRFSVWFSDRRSCTRKQIAKLCFWSLCLCCCFTDLSWRMHKWRTRDKWVRIGERPSTWKVWKRKWWQNSKYLHTYWPQDQGSLYWARWSFTTKILWYAYSSRHFPTKFLRLRSLLYDWCHQSSNEGYITSTNFHRRKHFLDATLLREIFQKLGV